MTAYARYTEYRPGGRGFIGPIPASWNPIRMRFVADPRNSNVDKKSYEGQREVVLCNYTDVYYNERLTGALEYMPATASDDEITAFSLKRGDVIITKDSETADDIGIPAFVAEELPGVVCGYHLCILRPRAVMGEFLFRVLQSHATKAFFFVEVAGVTRYGLGQDTIRDVVVPVPPVDEQEAICAWIDREAARITALIEKKTRFIELLREKRQAVVAHAVATGIDRSVQMKNSGDPWLGMVPGHWIVTQIKHIVDSIGQGWSPECEARPPEVGEWGVLKVGCVNGGVFRATESKALPNNLSPRPELGLRHGDVLVSRANTRELVGSCAVVPRSYPQLMLCDKLYRVEPADAVTPAFLAALISVHGRRAVEVEATGASSSMVNVSQEVVMNLRIALPSRAEQDQIIEVVGAQVERLDHLITATESGLILLAERRAALITAAVTGQIDVRAEAPIEETEPA